jgi:hypothetical protein
MRPFEFPDTGDLDPNDFVIKVLLKPGDVEPEFVRQLKMAVKRAKRWKKEYDRPLSTQL